MNILATTRLACLGFALSHCGASSPSFLSNVDEKIYDYIRVTKEFANSEKFPKEEFIEDHIRSENFRIGYLPKELAYTVQDHATILDPVEWAKVRMDPETLSPIHDPSGKNQADDHPPYAYHNYFALRQALTLLRDQAPSLVTLSSAGQSEEGRELLYVRLAAKKDVLPVEARPRILLVGNMHGDETVGREMLIHFAQDLVHQYAQDEKIKHILDHSEIFILPSMNPDGFELGRRFNRRGIDLNRDFPDFTTASEHSELGRAKETQAIMALHREFFFTLSLNFHGGEVCFNLPWDTKSNRKPDDQFQDNQLMQALGRAYADLNPTMRENSGGSFDRGVTYGYEWYEVNGGMQDWSIHDHDSTHATVELSFTKYPKSEALRGYFDENRASLIQFLESSLFGLHLSAKTEDKQNIPITVKYRSEGYERIINFPSGELHKATIPGHYSVMISAPGYKPVSLDSEASEFKGSMTWITLSK